MNTTNRIEEIKKRVREEIESVEEMFPMAIYNWSPDDWLNEIDNILEQKLLTYGDQRAEEGYEKGIRDCIKAIPLRSDWDDEVKVTAQMVIDTAHEALISFIPHPKNPEISNNN